MSLQQPRQNASIASDDYSKREEMNTGFGVVSVGKFFFITFALLVYESLGFAFAWIADVKVGSNAFVFLVSMFPLTGFCIWALSLQANAKKSELPQSDTAEHESE